MAGKKTPEQLLGCFSVHVEAAAPPHPASATSLLPWLGEGRPWSDDTDVSQAPRRVGTRGISPTAGKARFTWSLKVYVDREMGMLVLCSV